MQTMRRVRIKKDEKKKDEKKDMKRNKELKQTSGD
jgi:hypothetical protein